MRESKGERLRARGRAGGVTGGGTLHSRGLAPSGAVRVVVDCQLLSSLRQVVIVEILTHSAESIVSAAVR